MGFFDAVLKPVLQEMTKEAVKIVAPHAICKSAQVAADVIDGAINGVPEVPNVRKFLINYEGQPEIFCEIVEYIKNNFNAYYDENTISIVYEYIDENENLKMELVLDKQNGLLECRSCGEVEGEQIENIIHYEYENFIMKADLHGYDYVEVDDMGGIIGGLEPMFNHFLEFEKSCK